MKKKLTFVQGKDLHDFKIPSLNLVAEGEETSLILVPFRAYAMHISDSNDSSHAKAMEFTSDNMEYLYKKVQEQVKKYPTKMDYFKRLYFYEELSKTLKDVIKSFVNNNYGKDYECTLMYLHSPEFFEIEKEFIDRVWNWVESRVRFEEIEKEVSSLPDIPFNGREN
jgi:hypothetical protein